MGAGAPQNLNTDVVRVLVAGHAFAFEGRGPYWVYSNEEERRLRMPAVPPHWQREYILAQVTKRYPFRPVHVVTMDRMVSEHAPRESYTPSVFSGQYVESNALQFDMVFLPDLSGPWSDASNEPDTGVQTVLVIIMLEGALQLVRPGGWLYFSKLLRESYVHAGFALGASDADDYVMHEEGTPEVEIGRTRYMAIQKSD